MRRLKTTTLFFLTLLSACSKLPAKSSFGKEKPASSELTNFDDAAIINSELEVDRAPATIPAGTSTNTTKPAAAPVAKPAAAPVAKPAAAPVVKPAAAPVAKPAAAPVAKPAAAPVAKPAATPTPKAKSYRYTVSAPWISNKSNGFGAGDSPVAVIKNGPGNYVGYSALGNTSIMRGSTAWGLALDKNTPVLSGGNNWDHCGTWIQSAIKEGNVVKAFYHGEGNCNYSIIQTHKAMGYAESYDGGYTFNKVGYPNNLLIANKASPAVGTYPTIANISGEGDGQVVRFNGYYYMYFLNASDGWFTGAARSPLSAGGKPGSWTKYYNGSFSEPGLYGNSSALHSKGRLGMAIGLYKPKNELFLLGSGDDGLTALNGVTLSRSKDGVNFTVEKEPLILAPNSTWSRQEATQSLPELHAYLSIVDPHEGMNEFNHSFLMYYTYLFPKETFDNMYIAVRSVGVQEADDDPNIPRVKLELARYYNAQTRKMWTTTSLAKEGFAKQGVSNIGYDPGLGYIYTLNWPSMKPLYECYTSVWADYFVSNDMNECTKSGNSFVKTMGFVWRQPHATLKTQALYRCLNQSTLSYYVSADAACEGGTQEGILGYSEK